MNFSIVLLCFTKAPFPRMVPLHMPLPFNPVHPCVGCGKFPLNMEQAQIGWGLSMERDTQTMNPRLTAMVEVVEAHAMTSSNCRQFSRRSLSLESFMKKHCMLGWSESQQQWKVKVTRDPHTKWKNLGGHYFATSNLGSPYMTPCLGQTWCNVQSFGARCSSERTENSRKVKKIVDREGT